MNTKSNFQVREVIGGRVITFYGDSAEEIAEKIYARTDGNESLEEISKRITSRLQGFELPVSKPQSQPKGRRSISLADAMKAAQAVVKMASGDHVSRDEYSRRVTICTGCNNKSKVSDCMGCGASGKLTNFMMKVRSLLRLSYKTDSKINSQFCYSCGCSLALLLVTKVKNYKYESDEENKKRPSTCWLRRDSINFNNE